MELDFVWLFSAYMGDDEGGDMWWNWNGGGRLAICQRVVCCASGEVEFNGVERVRENDRKGDAGENE